MQHNKSSVFIQATQRNIFNIEYFKFSVRNVYISKAENRLYSTI